MLVALKRRLQQLPPDEQPKGILLGEFTDCSDGKWRVSTESVLKEFAKGMHLPVYRGFPFGHGERNFSFIQGLPLILR